MAPDSFSVVRRGPQVQRSTEQKPPESLLEQVPDGTIVKGPDGVQWIAMPAVPRRWERSKRPVKEPQAQAAAAAATQAPAAPAAQAPAEAQRQRQRR